ncbi:MAG: Glycosyltransferase [Candidatus Moranbacteria bacterium GW2011_GWC2_37_8]|nr:MAG: Glycosyltransferase [Candidatus Moranbacteria bacterium GW2011_GWC2_37_8]KKQ62313.1 MAG: Glycosyltransferase [Parcubacteria group bacterium GW2011_GWC1_38_22]
MKIAQIAPIVERVPPAKYGGTERVVYEITEQLVQMGHTVTLFASGNSKTSAKLESIYPRALREARIENLYGPNALTMLHIGNAYQMQNEFDIIHDHNGFISLPSANISNTPVVMTYHGSFNPEIRRLYQTLKKPFLVSISKAQTKGVDGVNLIGNVYNGLSMENYPFSNSHDGYLLFVGRISLEKGVHYAIQTALHLNVPLIIAAKLDDVDLPYFNQFIGPRLSENIKWIGEVNEEERNKLMSKAMCFLHPVTWKEPFGLTLIESMACGCPVVAFKRGSIPEVIINKKTGFVVSDIHEMIEAVKKIDTINREDCRKHALENFSARLMAERYEKIYEKILKRQLRRKK